MIRINGKQKFIKDIRSDIKYGATPGDFADYFGVSENEFMKALEDRIGQRFIDYKRDLNKNKARRKKMSKPKSIKTAVVEAEKTISSVISEATKTHEEIVEERIKSLKEKQNSLNIESKENEKNIKEVDNSINQIKARLLELAEEQKTTEAKLSNLNQKRSSIKFEQEVILLELSQTEEEIKKSEAELDFYREVKVSCTEEGITISKDGYEPTVSDIEKRYVELSKTGKFDDYTVKQVRVASKVLCVVEFLKEIDEKYSITYEENVLAIKEIVDAMVTA